MNFLTASTFAADRFLENDWVLTATHCFDRKPLSDGSVGRAKAEDLIVAAGGEQLNALPQTSKVTRIIGHEDYSDPFRGRDIALLS